MMRWWEWAVITILALALGLGLGWCIDRAEQARDERQREEWSHGSTPPAGG